MRRGQLVAERQLQARRRRVETAPCCGVKGTQHAAEQGEPAGGIPSSKAGHTIPREWRLGLRATAPQEQDEQASALWEPQAERFLIAAKTSGDVDLKEINYEERPGFEQALQAEVQSMIEQYTALTPISSKDCERMANELPDRISPSRYHLRRESFHDPDR